MPKIHAWRHPFSDDLQLGLDKDAALALHGTLVTGSNPDTRLLSILERYLAGRSLDGFDTATTDGDES